MIKIIHARCTECQICMEICSWTHFGENTPKRARIRVEADWPKIPVISVCQACKDHECVTACPHDALKWENWICLDENKCDACGLCVEACPVDGIYMDPIANLPLICDTCGGDFNCTVWCPTQALRRRDNP